MVQQLENVAKVALEHRNLSNDSVQNVVKSNTKRTTIQTEFQAQGMLCTEESTSSDDEDSDSDFEENYTCSQPKAAVPLFLSRKSRRNGSSSAVETILPTLHQPQNHVPRSRADSKVADDVEFQSASTPVMTGPTSFDHRSEPGAIKVPSDGATNAHDCAERADMVSSAINAQTSGQQERVSIIKDCSNNSLQQLAATQRPFEPSKESTDDKGTLKATSGYGHVVNHYPKSKRTHDVISAIAGINEHFDSRKGTKITRPNEAEVQGVCDVQNVHIQDGQGSPTESLWPMEKDSLALGISFMDTRYMGEWPENGFIQLVAEEYHSSEPVDGGTDDTQRTRHTRLGVHSSSDSQHGLSRNTSGGGGGNRDNAGPHDQPNPPDGPTDRPSTSEETSGFTCVFHHPENPNNDLTTDCATRHKFVSHLRVHHGCSAHAFYYCTACFTKFPNKAQRNAHDPKHCRRLRCVTEGCDNFNTTNVDSCEHPGRKNSQESIWKALFCLARPEDEVPAPFDNITTAPIQGMEPMTPANRPTSRPGPMGTSPGTESVSAAATASTYSTDFSDHETCLIALQALTRRLLDQLNVPDPNGLEVLRRMYACYMENEPPAALSQRQSVPWPGAVQGLRALNQLLWDSVQNPHQASDVSIRQLRLWAADVLPSRPGTQHSNSITEASFTHQTTQQPDAPTPMARVQSKDGHQRSQSVPAMNMDPFLTYDPSLTALMEIPELQMGLDEHSMGIRNTSFVGSHSPSPSQFSYMPFTHQDSADASGHRKRGARTSRTQDSGYVTGSMSGSHIM